jgi:uncharacterized membrane protein YphA (DoxX/SURF4 family)
VFIYHGFAKVAHPEMFTGFFGSIGLSPLWLTIVGYSEL